MTRQYNYSFEQKAKIASRKAVKEKEKEIKRLKKNLENKTTRLKVKKEALGVVQHREPTAEAFLSDEVQSQSISVAQLH